MRPTTLCFPKRENLFLLGRKKRGFGAGYYNGFGGKIEDRESFRACAVREVYGGTISRHSFGIRRDGALLVHVGEYAL